ncbi:MAG: aspartate carbamoyltransferase regulatory subunit [Prevotellaceae bacterium]|jgi:aspartate carbamoyltransferase regulatory subunit|nr:aspartate carbamoyltransferase regulatory subunit [Prevotellaceae bacterium]
MADSKKELVVVALENGTVIDHIPTDKLFQVVSLLKLDSIDSQLTIGNNLYSSKQGKKGILKITDKFFEPKEINKIALIAPCAKLNIIKNYEVVDKKPLELPDEITEIVKCVNPKCVTNNEPVKTRFHVVDKNNVAIKCCYCERIIQQEDIKIQ